MKKSTASVVADIKREGFSGKFYFLMKTCLSIFLLVYVVRSGYLFKWLFVNGAGKGYFLPFLWLYAFVFLIYSIAFYQMRRVCKTYQVMALIFILAALPRIAVMCLNYYIPTNDFQNYLLFGQNAFSGNWGWVADKAAAYMYPTMGGIALFNGLIARLFSPTLIGFQTANIIMTSLISVVLYLLLEKTDRRVALLAAMLYALYPSNIVSTQITTNQHGATLFFLIAIYFFLAALQQDKSVKYILYLCLSVGLLVISNFIHPSVIVVKLALLCYSIILIIRQIQITHTIKSKTIGRLACATIVMMLGTSILTSAGLMVFKQAGIIHDTRGINHLYKVVVGLNFESGGMIRQNMDQQEIGALPYDEQARESWKRIGKRLSEPGKVVKLVLQKNQTAWFDRDSYFNVSVN